MKIKPIIFGATGMVGEGVLHECLNHDDVESVLVINRRPCGITHDKLKEIILSDLFNISSIADQLNEYNACYFCAGVSSIGKNEDEYRKITYDLTMGVARTLEKLNPDMTFCYVSGTGTDSTEKGRIMWARVKGKTENDLLKLFKSAYMFRPGYIQPIKGLKNTYTIYKFAAPLYPLWKLILPNHVCTLEEVGLAMLNVSTKAYEKQILECSDIRAAAKS